MKRFLVILIPLFLSISQILFAGSLDYKGLEKISKNNTFMDGEGLPYPDDKITDKKNTLLIIFNHGSSADAKRDVCSKKAKVGKIGSAGLVPAIASLHNKKINNLEIKTDQNTALIALTHDPKIDDPALQHALKNKFFYIGALGSKKTHVNRCSRLKEAGFSDEQINKIFGPIGIKLGGRSAPEIALSIIAQLISKVYNK